MACFGKDDVVEQFDVEQFARRPDLCGKIPSAWEGLRVPEGWLCTRMMATALLISTFW